MSTRTRGIPTISAKSHIDCCVFFFGLPKKPFTSLGIRLKRSRKYEFIALQKNIT
jgi:hypothetical protein